MREAPAIGKTAGEHKFSVLIADDIHTDRILLKRAIRVSAPSLTVVGEVEDGTQTIAYLSGDDEYADRERHPFPDLLLLDLRMPLKDGFEVLDWLQKQTFPKLQVMVLAGSLEEKDQKKVRALGVEFAFLKPWNNKALVAILGKVEAALTGNGRRCDEKLQLP